MSKKTSKALNLFFFFVTDAHLLLFKLLLTGMKSPSEAGRGRCATVVYIPLIMAGKLYFTSTRRRQSDNCRLYTSPTNNATD